MIYLTYTIYRKDNASKKMNNNEAPGPNSIPAMLYKKCGKTLSSIVTKMFNNSFQHQIGMKPLCCLVLKPDSDCKLPKSFRPILLTPQL